MNSTLTAFARKNLKKSLAQCNDAQQHLFKQMYAHGKLNSSINNAIDQMPDEKLDWAMSQVERTLAKK